MQPPHLELGKAPPPPAPTEAEAALEASAAEKARARRTTQRATGAGLLALAMVWLVFGAWGVLIEALGCGLCYALWRLPAEGVPCGPRCGMARCSRTSRARRPLRVLWGLPAGVLLPQLVLLVRLVQHLRVRQVPVEDRAELVHHVRSRQAGHQLEDHLHHLLGGDVLSIRPHVLLQLPERNAVRSGLRLFD